MSENLLADTIVLVVALVTFAFIMWMLLKNDKTR